MRILLNSDGNSNCNFEGFHRVVIFILIISLRDVESKCAMKTCDAPARKKHNHDDSCAADILNSIKVRAILLRCPCDSCPDSTYNDKCHPISPLRKEAITAFPGFDSDEPVYHNEVTKCRRKLLITLEIMNGGKVSCDDEFIVINRVYDPMTKRKVRLLNTYVLKIRQEQTLQTYGLEFKQASSKYSPFPVQAAKEVVNGEAKEEVIDKRSTGFTGCDELSEQPTCGVAYYQGTLVPGSHGFCCSCNSSLNTQRQREYTDLLRQFLTEEHYASEAKNRAYLSATASPVTKFKKEIKSASPKSSHMKAENITSHKPTYEEYFDKPNTQPNGLYKKDVVGHGSGYLNGASSEGVNANDVPPLAQSNLDADLKATNDVTRGDDANNIAFKVENHQVVDSNASPLATLPHADRSVNNMASSLPSVQPLLSNHEHPMSEQVSFQNVVRSSLTDGKGTNTASKTPNNNTLGTFHGSQTAEKNANMFCSTPNYDSQSELNSPHILENGAGMVQNTQTYISQNALNSPNIIEKGTGIGSNTGTYNTQNAYSSPNLVGSGGDIVSNTPTYNTNSVLINPQRFGNDIIEHTTMFYGQHVFNDPNSYGQTNSFIEKQPKYNIQNAMNSPSPAHNNNNAIIIETPPKYTPLNPHNNGITFVAHNSKSQETVSNSLADGKSSSISKRTKYNVSDATGMTNQYRLPLLQLRESPPENIKHNKEENRRLSELRRRKALQKTLNRRLDFISDLVRMSKLKSQERKQRDAEEQLQFSDDEGEGIVNDVDSAWYDALDELSVGDVLEGDYSNYEDFITHSLTKRSNVLEKRSPHGGAKKKRFKIPITETVENMDVKPKLVREEEKEKREEVTTEEAEIKNVTEKIEAEDIAKKNGVASKQKMKPEVEHKAQEVKECKTRFIDDDDEDVVVLEDEEDADEGMQEWNMRRKRSPESRVMTFLLDDTDGVFTLADEAGREKRDASNYGESRGAENYGDNYAPPELDRERRKAPPSADSRGAKNCGDNYTPPELDPEKYHESAHCLRYSDLWYTVYGLKNPIVLHTVYFQLFEKHSLEDGTSHWQDLTRGKMVRLGTLWSQSQDETPTIAFTYTPLPIPKCPSPSFALDTKRVNLLVPQPVPKPKSDKYPQVKGGPTEFLVVNNNEVGHQCDKAGIGYQGFVTQEDRCSRPQGSCLGNQPADMWRADMLAQQQGRQGRYFLGNYGTVPREPIKSNLGHGEYLALEYHGVYRSAVDVEVKADFNPLIRVGSNAQLTEVYVDTTCGMMTKLTVVVANTGLASSSYKVLLGDCPAAPKAWARTQGQLVNIPPQHVQVTELKLVGAMQTSTMHCSVEVVNCRNELVATRRVRFERMDRCFCVWYCLCACIGTATGLGCDQMSPQHYHAAGFQGSVPVAEVEEPDTFWVTLLILLLGLFLILLLLGLTKAILGLCCCPIVGAWGLNVMVFHPIRLEEYYEPHLAGREVIYDEDGYPVHPDSHAHTVRAMSKHAEFCLNVIFFLALPLTVCWACCRRCCWVCCGYSDYDGDIDSRVVSTKHEDHICFETYDEDDTQYVIEELKRSKESIEELDETTPLLNTEADDYVKRLLASKVVFRNLREPTGGVQLPKGIPYCIRGFFVKIPEGYEFTTPSPFKQYWIFENGDLQMMQPAQNLNPNNFEVQYATAQEVFEHKQLSCLPKGFCVNVRFQDDMDFEDEDDY